MTGCKKCGGKTAQGVLGGSCPRCLLEAGLDSELDAQRTVTFASTASSGAGQPVPRIPETIARYRVVTLIGEGGMGTVYEAEQDHPRRTVALKVIKPGTVSPALLRRFEQEAEALGRLQHPGIAQIYEAGTADTGFGPQPYFAMELIRGHSLKDYAEVHRLSTNERLKIMGEVCEAVHHAHQRGLIHRDLKPGNILVDETGQPKILDFGVARVTDRDAHATSYTDVGQLIGTLAYMSPEQVLADPLGLDTRSDVYALGVILYELLAGKLPYDIGHKLHEALRAIQEEDPARLSTVNPAYRGDIETIVAKALEKDKTRRYDSAAEMAADIRRYLADEPIVARPASLSYQLGKFARRHRAVVGGAAAVFVVLVGGIVVSASQAARARRAEAIALEQRDRTRSERDRAVSAEQAATVARDRAEAERNKAVQEKKRADTQAATAAAVSEFLQKDLFEQASRGGRPEANLDQSLRGALDRSAANIRGKYDKDPLVEAGVREAIAQAYTGLLASREAVPHLERALEIRRRIQGEDDPDTLETMYRLGELYFEQKRIREAEALLTKVYESRLRVSGEGNHRTMSAMFALRSAYLGAGNNAAAEALLAKADAMWTQRAEEGLRGESPDDVRAFVSDGMFLGIAYASNHKTAALSIYNRAIDLSSRLLGKDDPSTVAAGAVRTILAPAPKDGKIGSDSVQAKLKDLDNSVMGALLQSAVRANTLIAGNKLEEAESVLKDGLVLAERAGSDDVLADTIVAGNRDTLGWLRLQSGKPAEAEATLREAAGVLDRVLPNTWEQFNNQSMLGAALEAQKKFAQAEPLLVSGYEGMSSRKAGTSTGRFTLDQAGEAVVKLYRDWGKLEKASEWKTRLAAVAEAKLANQ
jgi:non-specific serine/threonine protein kinase/serine/threonine-protein kinase